MTRHFPCPGIMDAEWISSQHHCLRGANADDVSITYDTAWIWIWSDEVCVCPIKRKPLLAQLISINLLYAIQKRLLRS